MSALKFGRYKAEVEKREWLALRNKAGSEKHLEIYGGLREGIGMKNVFARPNALRENAKTAISCR